MSAPSDPDEGASSLLVDAEELVSMRVAVSWSGGKDSCLACYKAGLESFKVSWLLSMVSKETGRSMSHGMDRRLMQAQSEAVGVPMVQGEVTWETYEQGFKDAVEGLKEAGVEGVVFGDIGEVPGHGDWVNRVCGELSVEAIEPLWGRRPEQVFTEFIDVGFEAVVVSVKADLFDEGWLGRKVDESLVKDLIKLRDDCGINICGELGEYHTLAVDGPLFKRRLRVIDGNRVLREGYWVLDMREWEVVGKQHA